MRWAKLADAYALFASVDYRKRPSRVDAMIHDAGEAVRSISWLDEYILGDLFDGTCMAIIKHGNVG